MSISSRTATKGQPAPDFTLVDQHGESFQLTKAIEDGPVVLVFLRGFI
jgi:peroxiredoxin